MHDVDNSVSVQEIGSVSRVALAVCVYGVCVGERVPSNRSPTSLVRKRKRIAMSIVDVS